MVKIGKKVDGWKSKTPTLACLFRSLLGGEKTNPYGTQPWSPNEFLPAQPEDGLWSTSSQELCFLFSP